MFRGQREVTEPHLDLMNSPEVLDRDGYKGRGRGWGGSRGGRGGQGRRSPFEDGWEVVSPGCDRSRDWSPRVSWTEERVCREGPCVTTDTVLLSARVGAAGSCVGLWAVRHPGPRSRRPT